MLKSALSLFLAESCACCDRPASSLGLCRDCHQQLWDARWPTADQAPPPGVVSWGEYGGILKRAIAQLKYSGQKQLAEPLGIVLAEAWRAAQPKPALRPLVVPIPLHESKQRQRGFNQAELIAAAFCRRLQLPLRPEGLRRVRSTTPQFQLGPAERQKNLADAFVWHPPPRRRQIWISRSAIQPVLLLDDIYTSGATMASARAAIEAAGWPVCGCIAIAQTRLS